MESQPTIPADLASAPPEARFGKFICSTKLGAGGMGDVWKAWDIHLGRWVALKFLRSGNPDEVDRFLREARTAARLNHPHIAAIYEADTTQDRPFIAMQLIDGPTLRNFPRTDRRTLVTLIRDAALAVQFAHEQGVIHRDLKSENLMVSGRSPHVFVMDFGLARQVEGERSLSGAIVGTPAYMPPEQACGGTVDVRADVYSLGATLYELITNRRPFEGTLLEILRKVTDEDPVRPRKIDPRIDADLESVVLACLEKSPDRRYETAAELAADLTRWLDGEPTHARSPSFGYRLGKRLAKRRGLVAALMGAAALGLAAMAVFLVPLLTYRDQELAHRADELVARDKLKRLEDAIRESRVFFYIEGSPMLLENLARVRGALKEVEELKKDARFKGRPEPWAMTGLAWYCLGDPDQAETPLLKSLKLNTKDGRVALTLARIHLDRSILVWAWDSSDTADEKYLRSRRQCDIAFDFLAQSTGEGGASDLDRQVAAGYRAFAERRRDDLRRICDEGQARFGETLGSEEFWILRVALSETPEERRACLDRTLQRRPHYPVALMMRSLAHTIAGRPMEAMNDLTRVLETNPQFGQAWMLRGDIKLDLGDLDGAIEDSSKAIEHSPRNAEAFTNRAIARIRRSDFAAAIRDLDIALELDPKMALAYFNRGVARKGADDIEGAFQDICRGIDLNPNMAEAYIARGSLRILKGDRATAIEDYTRAITLEPGNPRGYGGRGAARGAQGDAAGAIEDFTKAIGIDSKDANLYANRALGWLTQGNLERALEDSTSAIKLDPTCALGYITRGAVRGRTGENAGAIEDLERALRLLPPNTPQRSRAEADLKVLRTGNP